MKRLATSCTFLSVITAVISEGGSLRGLPNDLSKSDDMTISMGCAIEGGDAFGVTEWLEEGKNDENYYECVTSAVNTAFETVDSQYELKNVVQCSDKPFLGGKLCEFFAKTKKPTIAADASAKEISKKAKRESLLVKAREKREKEFFSRPTLTKTKAKSGSTRNLRRNRKKISQRKPSNCKDCDDPVPDWWRRRLSGEQEGSTDRSRRLQKAQHLQDLETRNVFKSVVDREMTICLTRKYQTHSQQIKPKFICDCHGTKNLPLLKKQE